MAPDHRTILIGGGQHMSPVPKDLSLAKSHVDMIVHAAQAALSDAGVDGRLIDWMGSVRLFSDSSPQYACPFGGPNAVPLAVAARIGATPKCTIYDQIGGQSPQTLVAEAAQALMRGEAKVALISGGEALANMRAAQRAGVELDWSETHDGTWEDRGLFTGAPIFSPIELGHGLMDAMAYYGFIETARRQKAGRNVTEHRKYMSELIAPLSGVAAKNPYAMFRDVYTAGVIAAPTVENRPLVSPFLKNMVAKDRVNQGAAVVMTTVATAREMGVPEAKWVYLRAHAQGAEKLMLEREDLSRSLALDIILEAALGIADVRPDQIDNADIYSCFPCVVDQAAEYLGRSGRDMTLTGGLPFFGGPGNNYTLHAICEAMSACRKSPGSLALVHGNGGWMSKQAVGLYSTIAPDGEIFADEAQVSNKIAAQNSPGWTASPTGEARMETYIVRHKRGEPASATVIGALENGTRFYAHLQDMTVEALRALAAGELDGARLRVEPGLPANRAWVVD